MFDQPRRLHFASIIVSSGIYVKQAIMPIIFATIPIFSAASKKNFESRFILLAIIPIVLILFVAPLIGYLTTRYLIRDDALIVSSGWLWKKSRTIPLARIHNVNLKANIFHRLLGATAVQVETAAGAGVEAELSAVSTLDAYDLQQALLRHTATETAEGQAPVEPPALYELTPRQLFVAGALNNRILYIIAGIVGVFEFARPAVDALKPVVDWIGTLSPMQGAILSAGIFLLLFAIGWLVSVIYSLTRFYGFRMTSSDKGLKVQYGLFTKVQNVVPPGRVQTIRITQPMLFRLFGYCELYANTAGTFDAKEMGGANKLCPITKVEEIDRMGAYVFPDFRFSEFDWRQVSPVSVYRNWIGGFITSCILFAAPLVFLIIRYQIWMLPVFVVPALIPLSYLSARLKFRYTGYALQHGFVAARSGVIRTSAAVMPLDRLQWAELSQSPFQRRWKLASLKLHTCAPLTSVLTIDDLEEMIAREMQEEFILQAAKSRFRWRGGL